MVLEVVPVTLAQAAKFTAQHHRHNQPVTLGAIFVLGLGDETGTLRGVAVIGRPVARMLCDGWTAEVLRTCTDGVRNGNSMLYGAAWRAARSLGYRRLVTYTQQTETGASLRAVGFRTVAALGKRSGWNMPNRRRDDTAYLVTDRWRWEITTDPPNVPLPVLDDDDDDQLVMFEAP